VVHDPTDPVGRLLFNVLAMVAEFEADLIRLRTREGMKVAKAKGRVRGKPPKLNARQEARLVALHQAGEHSTAEIADLFGVGCSTVYRAIERHTQAAAHREESTDNDSLADRRPPHTHGRRRLSLLQGGRDGLRSASAARGAPHGTSVSFLRANRPSGLGHPAFGHRPAVSLGGGGLPTFHLRGGRYPRRAPRWEMERRVGRRPALLAGVTLL
jgi:Resolvase, N terminal domain/Helix-turn-helix domain of resolvase